MSKKLLTLITLLLMAGLLLVACGGDETAEETAEEPAPTEAPEEEEMEEEMEEEAEDEAMEEEEAMEEDEAMDEEDEAMEEEDEAMEEDEAVEEDEAMEEFDVSITIWADDTRAPILLDLAEGFQEAYGVGLVVEQVADIREQFVVAAPAGEGPDIIILPHDQMGQLADSGLLAPIDLGDKAGQFSESSLSAFQWDGEQLGMPYAVENLAFFRNTDLVPDAPTSWDEVIEIGSALQADGTTTYGFALTGTTYDAYPILTNFGGYVFGRDEIGNYNPEDVGIDSEGMVAAGDFLAELVANGVIPESTDWDTSHVLFENGETPFLMAGPWALDRLRAAGVPYGISDFPGEGVSFLGVQGFMINGLSENVLLAQAFLTEFVATEETMLALQIAGNRPSAWPSVADLSDDADLAAFGSAGANAQPMPAIPEMGSVWGSWSDAFTLILTGEQTAVDALSNGATQIRSLIGGAAAGMVNVPGSWQAAAGVCDGDWDPACEGSALTETEDGLFTGSFDLPAGDYEVKVALDGGWTLNYGVDGEVDGANYAFTMDADGTVTFTYDPATNLLTIETSS